MIPNENEIIWRDVKEDDFQRAILGGEIQPHNVEILVRFRDGTTQKINVSWESILDFSKCHGLSAVKEYYEMLVN
jgi:PAS domain-containing protein